MLALKKLAPTRLIKNEFYEQVKLLEANGADADSLKERGWNLYRIYAHDWADNAEAERDALAAALKKYVN